MLMSKQCSIKPELFEDDMTIFDKIHSTKFLLSEGKNIIIGNFPGYRGIAICLNDILDTRGMNAVKNAIQQELNNALEIAIHGLNTD